MKSIKIRGVATGSRSGTTPGDAERRHMPFERTLPSQNIVPLSSAEHGMPPGIAGIPGRATVKQVSVARIRKGAAPRAAWHRPAPHMHAAGAMKTRHFRQPATASAHPVRNAVPVRLTAHSKILGCLRGEPPASSSVRASTCSPASPGPKNHTCPRTRNWSRYRPGSDGIREGQRFKQRPDRRKITSHLTKSLAREPLHSSPPDVLVEDRRASEHVAHETN